ncbi:UvrD-helicase domain-containing protein [Burkholderia stagnalis]|uniref:UvrD-helicase domain-containing protein n=1 Tax=Burkholderia stagnalis TaxID=1503054 RepID=UPI000F5C293F|nr:UvrD-helicase domain-containing protein [Burkholderia stagnalis]RQY17972.1 ATP-dependent helicase [Burkholderia stagnalis]RQY91719.1 ATP-dependent helicase [Burkholderia stagnalis]RQY99548.1 ATP-dependent helicase [Burkholderia stagnalis]
MNSRCDIAVARQLLPNPEQLAVLEARADEWLLVEAGPGTGKTQMAAMRLAHLLQQGLQPAQILVLSFSRSAVATLTRRIAGLSMHSDGVIEDLRHLAIRTFDSWAFRMLRQNGAPVADLLRRSHDENIASVTEELRADTPFGERLASIRHVIVDEFQDLPGVRAEMVIALLRHLNSDPGRRVGFTVLGDPAQSIYRFAARATGGEPPSDAWAELKNQLGPTLREIALIQNHRATKQLAGMAARLRKILGDPAVDADKKLAAMKRFLTGLPTSAIDLKLGPEWLAQLPQGSLAVLTRTNGEALRVWQMLLGQSIEAPQADVRLRLAGSTRPTPAWIAAVLSRYKPRTITRMVFEKAHQRLCSLHGAETVERLRLPTIEVGWKRLARASGASDMATVIDLDMLGARLDWPDSFPEGDASAPATVLITTVHQAKGMEFDNVALLEVGPRNADKIPVDSLEEANVDFVAVTRAARYLGRLPSSCIYTPLWNRNFSHGRVRQVDWKQMVNVQMGLPGDIDATSFVDPSILGGDEAVSALQDDLLKQAADLRGRKVILRKVSVITARSDTSKSDTRRVQYDICLQTADGEGPLIGRTSDQLTHDLLDLLWSRGYDLPRRIYNLRIADVVSVTDDGELPESIPDPWRSSRLWFGICLMGSGDFKTWKRNGK